MGLFACALVLLWFWKEELPLQSPSCGWHSGVIGSILQGMALRASCMTGQTSCTSLCTGTVPPCFVHMVYTTFELQPVHHDNDVHCAYCMAVPIT